MAARGLLIDDPIERDLLAGGSSPRLRPKGLLGEGLKRIESAGKGRKGKPGSLQRNLAYMQDALTGFGGVAGAPINAAVNAVAEPVMRGVMGVLDRVPSPDNLLSYKGRPGEKPVMLGDQARTATRRLGKMADAGSDALGYDRDLGRELAMAGAGLLAPAVGRGFGRVADAAESTAGRLGYTFAPDDTVMFSAGGPMSVRAARRAGITPTTTNTQRIAFPGIYKHPNELTDAAAALVAPESPALKGLFGVTRDDLYQIGRGRKGNVDATAIFPAGARGSEAASNVTTGRNAQRLVDAMSVAEQRAPQLTNPMDAWYVMDPAFQRLEQLVGREEAVRRFSDLNAFTSMASPASDVITEMNRGTTANYLNRRGRFGDFEAHSTTPVGKRGGDFPADISGLKPHPYGGTAHSQPMRKYVDGGLLDSGFLNVQTSKVPTYHMASGVPETGFQTNVPVGDAHFARAIGLPDVRNMLTLKGRPVIPQANATMPEISTLTPWWQQRVVGPLGIESVPGQARAWGLFSPQSGVDTPIGAPKLELLAAEIERLALQSGVDPAQLRDAILLGEAGLGNNPAMLPGLLSRR